ncbi:hypothetical protein G7013_16200 [Pseudomonas viridiflava]|uniref:hypothetical protein n=1 Tax=Pseudomonas viridiflava TaxID=33069 RepID=UPI0015E45604|nr:hypothetical protein [Pseudomonas viridiflava]MBA1231193.1 hypothetical protein [Pseudomonas viridiflava]
MLRLPLTGTRMPNPQSSHHACDTRAQDALSLIAKAFELPLRLTRYILNTGHYHYSGLASVTAAAWNCVTASVTLPLIAFLNELYTMTPTRLKNA